MVRTVASIEARMGSSRLPGKMMMDINGWPAIRHVVERLKRCKNLDGIVLATTNNIQDHVLVDWANTNQIDVFCGSEKDVLGRVVSAQEFMQSDVVVEICGDMILLDPAVIDEAIEIYHKRNYDIVTTTRQRSYADGIDVQVFSLRNLKNIAKQCNDAEVREHVSLYFYQNYSRYHFFDLIAPDEIAAPDIRLLLDTKKDLLLLREICINLGNEAKTKDIISLVKQNPKLLALALG